VIKPKPCHFPPPWSIEELEACFVVKDASGQKLGYFYFEEELGRAIGGEAADAQRSREITHH
jgi:hypothetical protein